MTVREYGRPPETADSDHPVHKGRAWMEHAFITDDEGNPRGGESSGEGFKITWQNGVLEPTGATVEDLIATLIMRMRYYQGELPGQEAAEGKFRCRENFLVITHLEDALHWQQHRTRERRSRGVEGTYKK